MEGEDLSPQKDNSAGAEGTSMRSLEALLLAKNRHLEHELTMARLQVADLTGIPCSAYTPIPNIHRHCKSGIVFPSLDIPYSCSVRCPGLFDTSVVDASVPGTLVPSTSVIVDQSKSNQLPSLCMRLMMQCTLLYDQPCRA